MAECYDDWNGNVNTLLYNNEFPPSYPLFIIPLSFSALDTMKSGRGSEREREIAFLCVYMENDKFITRRL
jgi:guanylate kinase